MPKTYLLYRCGEAGHRAPVTFFTADSEQEAREAPTWLRHQHPDSPLLHLEPGEFFEIIEEGRCPPQEWEEAKALLGSDARR